MKEQIRQITIKSPVELRDAGNVQTVVGIIPFNSRSVDMGYFTEVITETAFSKTLADGADVKALYNHDTGKVLGRTKNGTLRLSVGMLGEVQGLVCECDLSDTSFSRDVYALIKRGDVNTMSFGFYPVKERVEMEGDTEVHYLLEVRLIEVSFAVPFPAYEETNSVTRQVYDIDIGQLETILSKPVWEPQDRMVLKNFAEKISGLAESGEPETTPAVEDTGAGLIESLYIAALHKE